jgi:hypothetical protein
MGSRQSANGNNQQAMVNVSHVFRGAAATLRDFPAADFHDY